MPGSPISENRLRNGRSEISQGVLWSVLASRGSAGHQLRQVEIGGSLETDNEHEARKSAQSFDFPGFRHFYDGRKEIGARLTAEQFPNAIRDALDILTSEHEMRASLEVRKDLPPEKMPLWDAVLVFPPGVRWDEQSPRPVRWTKQTSFIGEAKPGEMTALFWKNSTRQLPVLSDWYVETREAWRVARNANSGAKQP